MDNKTECVKKCIINGKHVEDFNCAICHEVYENPRYLQCNHSFCLKCIITYIRLQLRENCLATNFCCPLCRANINISMKRLRKVIYVKELDEDDVKDIFPRNIALASATESLNTEKEFCKVHPKKIYEYFCKDHGILCCSKCVLKTHRQCKRVIDMDECDQQAFGGLLHDSQRQLLASYKLYDLKIRSLERTRQRTVNSLESFKSDVIDSVTKAQEKVNEILTEEIETAKQQYGPRPNPVPYGFTCNRQEFTLEMQNISSRITDIKRRDITDNLAAKLAVSIDEVRASIKRKVDSADIDSYAATWVKRTMPKEDSMVLKLKRRSLGHLVD